jgi:hypothetical protein
VETPLVDAKLTHLADQWHTLALVFDGTRMMQYADGVEELSAERPFAPRGPGRTCLGARINQVSHFRGAIATVRFTPRALPPGALLRP